MPEFTVNPNRTDPYKNFKFRILWDNKPVLGVSKVGALKRTTEVVKHRGGGENSDAGSSEAGASGNATARRGNRLSSSAC